MATEQIKKVPFHEYVLAETWRIYEYYQGLDGMGRKGEPPCEHSVAHLLNLLERVAIPSKYVNKLLARLDSMSYVVTRDLPDLSDRVKLVMAELQKQSCPDCGNGLDYGKDCPNCTTQVAGAPGPAAESGLC